MNLYLVLSTLLLAAVIAFTFYSYASGSITLPLAPNKPTILLVGPSLSGKTCLFQRIVHNKADSTTYISQRANVGDYVLEDGQHVKIIDSPGHPKLFTNFKSYSPTAIAFVLDASTLAKTAANVSRNLIDVLTFARTNKIDKVIVIGTKSDFFTALSVNRIISTLESEVNQIRTTKSGTRLDSISERENDVDEWLYDLQTDFTFKDEEIKVVTGSVVKDDTSKWTAIFEELLS